MLSSSIHSSHREAQPDAKIESVHIDLADLSSVAECYKQLCKKKKLEFDVLMNNAGACQFWSERASKLSSSLSDTLINVITARMHKHNTTQTLAHYSQV